MRSIDERCTVVRSRAKRLRRKRNDRMLATLICLMAIPLTGLVGRAVVTSAAEGAAQSPAADGGLFGAASLFGSSAGGYVLVALVTAVVVALIAALCITRRRTNREETAAPDAQAAFPDETDTQKR